MMAARVIARLTGERVVIQDDGSKDSMADIRVDYADRPPAYVEVVIDLDHSYASMEAAIHKKSGSPVSADLCWWVEVSPKSRQVIELRRELPGILGRSDGSLGEREREQLSLLGVAVRGSAAPPPGKSGEIYLLPEGIYGPSELSWQPLLGWIDEFLHSIRTADVRKKLAATDAAERHAFIAASFTTPGAAYFALDDDWRPELPDQAPALPPEITHLWVWSVPALTRCLAWFPGTGWIDPVDHWATA
jgi:hypothetical protein